MSEAKFTPGPWAVDTWAGSIVGTVAHTGVHESVWASGELMICTTGLQGTPESRENAHLIAAAPDLYAALLLLASPSMSESRPHAGESSIGWQRGDGPTANERLTIARAALAKATP